MYSSEAERVQLIQLISTSEARGAVEKWLVQVEDIMLRSVRDVVARSRVVRLLHHYHMNIKYGMMGHSTKAYSVIGHSTITVYMLENNMMPN